MSACRNLTGFDAYVRERLAHSKTEAARVVLDFVAKDRVNMGEAVLLAIEALPMRKTKQLRRIVDLYEPWCEWLDKWLDRGWELDYPAPNYVNVMPPDGFDYNQGKWPDADVVAAAAGVDQIWFLGRHRSLHGGGDYHEYRVKS